MTRVTITVVAALLVALAAAPGLARDTLTIGITQFPATFHPNINSMLAKSYVLNMALRPITTYDQDWTLACLLCTTLPTIENGLAVPETLADGSTGVAVTYTIHPNATWGDGTPVSAQDVVFTWEVGRNEQSGFAGLEGYRRTLAIDVIDDKTFTVHGDRLSYTYNAMNGFYILPAHLERDAFAEPSEYRFRTRYDTDTTNPGLYFGPYRIVEVVSGSHVMLEANPTWWGPAPGFRRIVVRTIENTAALEANLLSGAIDYVAGELGFTIEQALSFERRKGGDFEVLFKPGLIYEHIDLNLDNPILADRRLRQALLYALDREQLSSQLFGGQQPVAHSNINPLDRIYSATVPVYDHDPDKAAALLDDAGWRQVRDGVRHNEAGEKLSLILMTTAGNKSRELVEQVLQSQWKKAGIEIVIRNEPARVYFGETMTKRANSGLSMYAWLSAPESLPLTTLRSDNIPNEANGWSGQNYPGYANPEMDRLIDAIEIELDPEARLPMWAELQRLYATDLPALPLFFRAEAYFFPKWLKGVRPSGHMVTTTTWVEEWHAIGD
ncbi:MAG: peptide ABC transporter substrate-binding protein [Alphaproteobacteria bacterium]|jgi:peptide/nickel transport system substrate-binding protein|nr:peptide ABC transporter substrate-binding protein [Alphaproteobacteria bacterium]